MHAFREPGLSLIWLHPPPFDALCALRFSHESQLALAAPVFRHAIVVQPTRRAPRLANGDSDADADLYAEDVVRCARELGIAAHVAMQVEMVDGGEVLQQMLAHAIEGDLVYE